MCVVPVACWGGYILVNLLCMCQVIPVYEQGSQFQPSAIEMVDGQTSPPQLLTEADLISLMEKHGIGTVQIHKHTHTHTHTLMETTNLSQRIFQCRGVFGDLFGPYLILQYLFQ